MEKKLTLLRVNALTVENLNALTKKTVELAEASKEHIGLVGQAILVLLTAGSNKLNAQIGRAEKSALTPEITALDKERDDIFLEILREVNTSSKSRYADKKAAADNLAIFLGPYKGTDKKPLNTETKNINNLVGGYKADATLVANATLLGIAPLFTELETKNKDFDPKYTQRNAEQGSKGDAATSYKLEVEKNYVAFCISIEQMADFLPNPTVMALFDQMNELRMTYHNILKRRKTSKDSDSDDLPEK